MVRSSFVRPERAASGASPPATEGGRRENVADETRRYLEGRPAIRDCLRYDIINFTALARRIRAETGLTSQEAVEIACRRFRRQMQAEPTEEERLRTVLRSSHLEIRTHVAVVTVLGDLEFMEKLVVGAERLQARRTGLVQLFQGSGLVTVLCEDAALGVMMNMIPRNSVLYLQRRLSVVSVQSPEEVLATPRVLGFLAEAIGRAGINCVEMMSVHTETLFVLRAADALRAFEVLSDLARSVADGATGPEEDEWPSTPPIAAVNRARQRAVGRARPAPREE